MYLERQSGSSPRRLLHNVSNDLSKWMKERRESLETSPWAFGSRCIPGTDVLICVCSVQYLSRTTTQIRIYLTEGTSTIGVRVYQGLIPSLVQSRVLKVYIAHLSKYTKRIGLLSPTNTTPMQRLGFMDRPGTSTCSTTYSLIWLSEPDRCIWQRRYRRASMACGYLSRYYKA